MWKQTMRGQVIRAVVRTRIVLTGLFMFLAGPVQAHDFWLAPDIYHTEAGDPVTVRFLIGHTGETEPWRLRWDRVVSLQSIHAQGLRDHQTDIVPGDTDGFAKTVFHRDGTHILAFASHHAEIILEADQFNDYLKKEGLTPAIELRRKLRATGEPGREIYSRRAKALIQVGDTVSGPVTEPIGHTLEIVPERNPYALDEGEDLTVRVLFLGKPLEGATIDMESLAHGQVTIGSRITDRQGRARFRFPRQGAWKLNVIWTRPLEDTDKADFETVFSSLTFGYVR